MSSGSPGSALLLSPDPDAGVILHTEFARPDEWRAKSVAMLGPTPAAELPNAARNRYATDLLLRIGLPEVRPDVVFVWYSDPDTTAHARGLDDPATRESLSSSTPRSDGIEDWLRDQGRLESTNLLVTSDHGFSDPYRRIRPCGAGQAVHPASCPTARPTSWSQAARCIFAERPTMRAWPQSWRRCRSSRRWARSSRAARPRATWPAR